MALRFPQETCFCGCKLPTACLIILLTSLIYELIFTTSSGISNGWMNLFILYQIIKLNCVGFAIYGTTKEKPNHIIAYIAISIIEIIIYAILLVTIIFGASVAIDIINKLNPSANKTSCVVWNSNKLCLNMDDIASLNDVANWKDVVNLKNFVNLKNVVYLKDVVNLKNPDILKNLDNLKNFEFLKDVNWNNIVNAKDDDHLKNIDILKAVDNWNYIVDLKVDNLKDFVILKDVDNHIHIVNLNDDINLDDVPPTTYAIGLFLLLGIPVVIWTGLKFYFTVVMYSHHKNLVSG